MYNKKNGIKRVCQKRSTNLRFVEQKEYMAHRKK